MKPSRVRLAALGTCLVVCICLVAPKHALTAATKLEVRTVDVGHVLGQAGVKVRLTLSNREAVEYRTEDAAETEAVLHMTDMFLRGTNRMFAEVEGSSVRAIQVSGPFAGVAQR